MFWRWLTWRAQGVTEIVSYDGDFDRAPQLQRVEPYERRSIGSTEEASRVRTALVRLGRLPTAALLTRPDDTVPEPPSGQGNVDAPSLG